MAPLRISSPLITTLRHCTCPLHPAAATAAAGNLLSLEVRPALFTVREGRLLGELLAAMKGATGGQVSAARLALPPCLPSGASSVACPPPSCPLACPLACPLPAHCTLPVCSQVFEIWMKQQSDAVQHTATVYAEREVLEACARTLAQRRQVSPALRALLEPVVQLYALYRLEQVRPLYTASLTPAATVGACTVLGAQP